MNRNFSSKIDVFRRKSEIFRKCRKHVCKHRNFLPSVIITDFILKSLCFQDDFWPI